MGSNVFYDLIEDIVISVLETGVKLPREFEVTIGQDEMRAFIKAGLINRETKEPIPDTKKSVVIPIANHWLTIRVENNEPEETQERVLH